MSYLGRFPALIASRIHECAPDHSVETITVGELRRTAREYQEMLEALVALVPPANGVPDECVRPEVIAARAAIAKAAGQ